MPGSAMRLGDNTARHAGRATSQPFSAHRPISNGSFAVGDVRFIRGLYRRRQTGAFQSPQLTLGRIRHGCCRPGRPFY